MPSQFHNSGFHDIISKKKIASAVPTTLLGGVSGSTFAPHTKLTDIPIVVFDFETTGLEARTERIIEIGAVKFVNRKESARFTQLINPGKNIPQNSTDINGITNEMVASAPTIDSVFPALHDFMRGCLGVAHNADFDAGFLSHESARLGVHCNYHLICTLKMSRALVKTPRHNLDTLANHYGFEFEARHRSIGDILVTAKVFWRMLDENNHLQTLGDLTPYKQDMISL